MAVLRTVVAVGSLLCRLHGGAFAAEQGSALYAALCASCHGPSGGGDGPAADAMTPRPTDLRRSKLDEQELMKVIDGRRSVLAHGSARMPVWGRILESRREDEPHAGRTTLLEIQALADYVRRLRAD